MKTTRTRGAPWALVLALTLALAALGLVPGATPTASAITYYDITAAVEDGVGGSVVSSSSNANEGRAITLTVTASNGYELDTLTVKRNDNNQPVDVSLTSSSLNIKKFSMTMPASAVTATAKFKKVTYNVVVQTVQHGKVTASKTTAQIGDTFTLEIESEAGYKLNTPLYIFSKNPPAPTATVSSTLYATPNAYGIMSYTVPGFDASVTTITVAPRFVPAGYHNIEVNPEPENGTVTLGRTTAPLDDTVRLFITPAAGKRLETVTVRKTDEPSKTTPVSPDNSFTMPDYDVYVTATFIDGIPHKITVDPVPQHGEVIVPEPYATEGAAQGLTIELTVTPEEGYELTALTARYKDDENNNVDLEISAVPDAPDKKTFIMPNYPVTVSATFKKTQTIAPESVTVTYGDTVEKVADTDAPDGADKPALTYVITSGDVVMEGDEVVSEAIISVDADGKLTALNVGDAVVTVKAEENEIYARATKDVKITVNKKDLTVTANNHTITYGDAPENKGVTYDGFVNEENESVLSGTLAYAYDYAQYGDAGSYNITPSGLSSDNYNIIYKPGALTVNQKEVGLTWSGTDFTYDGNPHAPTATATGTVNGDAITVTVDGAQTNANTDPATYTATATGLTGEKSGNYKLPENKTTTFTIGKAAAPSSDSLSAEQKPTGKSLSYNGKDQSLVAAPNALPNGYEKARYSTDGVEWKDEITGKDAGNYPVKVKYVGDSNHTDFNGKDVTGTITTVALKVTANNHTVIYGDAPTNDGVTYTGFVNDETASVLSGTLSYTYSYTQYGDAGNNYTITPSGLTSKNYAITFEQGVLTVTPKTLSLTWGETTSFTYDGTEKCPALTAAGVVNEDDVKVTVTGAQKDVGSYTATATLTGAKSGNYALPEENTKGFTITKAPAPKPGDLSDGQKPTATNPTYNGENQALVAAPNALPDGYTKIQYSTDGGETWEYEIPAGKNEGDYPVKAKYVGDDNHADSDGDDILNIPATIQPKEVTLTWSGDTLTYNGNPQAPSATAGGLVSGDECDVTVDGAQTDAGEGYVATATKLSNNNYALPADNDTTFKIEKAPAPLLDSLSDEQKPKATNPTYNGEEQALVAAPNALPDGYTKIQYSTDGGKTWKDAIPAGTDAGNYPVKVKYIGDKNHTDFNGADIDATIKKRPVTVTASDQKVSLNASISTDVSKATLSGAVTGHTLSAVTLTGSSTAHVTTSGTITPSAAKIQSGDNTDVTANYTISYTDGALTVVEAAASVVEAPVPKTLTYTGEPQPLVEAGKASGGTLRYAIGTKDAAPADGWNTSVPTGTNAGTYYVWYKVDGDDDHSDTAPASVSAVINPKSIDGATVTLDKDTTPYSGAAQSVSVTGVKLPDNTELTPDDYDTGGETSGTNAKEYTVTVTGKGNYTGSAKAPWSVTPASSIPGGVSADNVDVTYDGKPHGITVKAPEGAAVKYGTKDGTYDQDKSPTITNVKDSPLTVYYQATVDNYQPATGSATVTIRKADSAITKRPSANELTYTGEPQELVTAGEATGGTMVYSLEKEGDYNTEIPAETDAGDYRVYYKVEGNENYNGVDTPKSVPVTIEKKSGGDKPTVIIGDVTDTTITVDAPKGDYEYSGNGGDTWQDSNVFEDLTPATEYPITARKKGTDNEEPGPVSDTVKVTTKSKETNVRALTFYSDSEGKTILKRESVSIGASLAPYENVKPADRDNYTFAAWSSDANVQVSAFRDKNGNLTEGVTVVDWTGTMPDKDMNVYPIWIHDRLNIRLNLGAYDGNNNESWYHPTDYDTRTPAIMDASQSRDFTVDLNERIAMKKLIAATRAGYELTGWHTQGGVLWNGDDWKTLSYADGFDETVGWSVTPTYCDKENGQPVIQTNERRAYKYYTVTLTAHWKPLEVRLTYTGEGANMPADSKTRLGDTIVIGDAPVPPDGKKFIGWTDANGALHSPGEHFVFEDWTLQTDGVITLTSTFIDAPDYAITFDSAGGTPVEPIANYELNKPIDEPTTTRTGYAFNGWYEQDARVEFPLTPTAAENRTFTAGWTVKQYTISFKTNGGSEITPITQDYGTPISEPKAPEKAHYDFGGWRPELPETMPAKDTTLEAQWTPTKYMLHWRTDEGAPIQTITEIYGGLVEKPDDPVKEGYTFTGWEPAFPTYMPDDNPADDPIENPVIITAQWKKNVDKPDPPEATATNTTITVTKPKPEDGYEFSKDEGGTWQDSNVFPGLTPDTVYPISVRLKETDDTMPSPASDPTHVRTKPNPPEAEATDTTITVTKPKPEDGYEYSDDGGETWQDAPVFPGLTPDTEYPISVRKKTTDSGEPGPASDPTIVKTKKSGDDKPNPPEAEATDTTITVTKPKPEDGYEYSNDEGKTWQDDPVFPGLTPDTEYPISVRKKTTDGGEPGPASDPTPVRTKKSGDNKPNPPEAEATDTTITVTKPKPEDGYEYSDDGGETWQDDPVFPNLDPDTEYPVSVRKKGTDDTMPSPASDPTIVRTDKSNANVKISVYEVLQNADGSWSEPAQPERTVTGAYTVPALEGFRAAAYSLGTYQANEANRSAVSQGQSVRTDGYEKLYVYYARNVRRLLFYSDSEGKTLLKSESVLYGASLAPYEDVKPDERANYTFAAWSPDANIQVSTFRDKKGNLTEGVTVIDWTGTMPDEDMKAYPIWIHDRLNILLNLGADENLPAEMDASQSDNFTVDLNERIAMKRMIAATRAGYKLIGWYTQDGVLWNGEDWDDLPYSDSFDETVGWGMTPTYCDKDANGEAVIKTNASRAYNYYTVTLTAHWEPVDVSIAYTGEGANMPTDSAAYRLGDTIIIGAAPVAPDGKMFVGWTDTNNALHSPGEHFVFEDWTLQTDGVITLRSTFINAPEYAITFHSNGGTPVDPITHYELNTPIPAPTEPTKPGHTFNGWYEEQDGAPVGDPIAFPLTPTVAENRTLIADWTPNEYEITFNANGGAFKNNGGASVTRKQTYGTAIVAPEAPERFHYAFNGWLPALPGTMPAKDLTVAAQWKPVKYTLLWRTDEGAPVQTITAIYGGLVEKPDDPVKDGYTFTGWKPAFPTYMPDDNPADDPVDNPVIITGQWRKTTDKPDPIDPADADSTDTTITVRKPTPEDGYEFSDDGGVTWQESPFFPGLTPDTEYPISVRKKGTDGGEPGPASDPTPVRTKKPGGGKPDPIDPADAESTTTTITVKKPTPEDGYEFSDDGGGTWQESPFFPGLTPDTEYPISVRKKGTDDTMPSPASDPVPVRTKPVQPVTPVTPSGGGGGGGSYTQIYLITVEEAEHGAATASAYKATNGARITVTPAPFEGYVTESVSVQNARGRSVTVKENANGTYVFNMPPSDVTVSVSFTADSGKNDEENIPDNGGNVPDTGGNDRTPADASQNQNNPFDSGVSEWLISKEHPAYIAGYSDGTFRPNNSITRAQTAMMIYRLLKDKEVEKTETFNDMDGTEWYAEAAYVLASLGVVQGYSDGSFRGQNPITRAAFTAILTRFAEDAENVDPDAVQFADVPREHWAHDVITKASFYGWISGYGDGTFHPAESITRAAAIAIINRMLGREADAEYIAAHADELKSFSDVQNPEAWYYYNVAEAANEHTFQKADGKELWNR